METRYCAQRYLWIMGISYHSYIRRWYDWNRIAQLRQYIDELLDHMPTTLCKLIPNCFRQLSKMRIEKASSGGKNDRSTKAFCRNESKENNQQHQDRRRTPISVEHASKSFHSLELQFMERTKLVSSRSLREAMSGEHQRPYTLCTIEERTEEQRESRLHIFFGYVSAFPEGLER